MPDLGPLSDTHENIVEIAGFGASTQRLEAASKMVRAQLLLERIDDWRRHLYEELFNSKHPGDHERVRRLAALDRYERYAHTKMRQALAEFER